MSEIVKKRDLMEICNKLMPIMDESEINTLAVTIGAIMEHMADRGVGVIE